VPYVSILRRGRIPNSLSTFSAPNFNIQRLSAMHLNFLNLLY
jgi:hypothetical protein